MADNRWRPNTEDCRSKLQQKISDADRWSRIESYSDEWDMRAKLAAQFLGSSRSVLDLGAGKMALKSFLPDGCVYQPADIAPLDPDALIVDLNTPYLPSGDWDSWVMLGVLEYLFDPIEVLKRLRARTAHLVFSYGACLSPATQAIREDVGFANHLSEEELLEAVASSGWRIAGSTVFFENFSLKMTIYDCRSPSTV